MTSWCRRTTTARSSATSVAQTRQVKLRSVKATVAKAAARATSKQRLNRATLGKSRLVVLQTKHSRLAWETWVTGRKHGEASRLTVYVDARTGRVLTTKEHVLHGTGTGNWEGTVTFPTTLSGSTYSMTNPNAPTLRCQNSTGNATFTGPDDVWGNGVGTNRETGCVDAFYSAEKMRQMMSSWLGRNGMNGSGGWVPIRVGLNDVNAYYDGTQVQIGHNKATASGSAAMDVVAHEFGHGVDDRTPGGISGGGTQEFVGDTFGCRNRVLRQQPGATSPTSSSARRSTWSARARSATCTTRRRSATRTATRARSRAPRCTRPPAPATTGSTCCRRAPTRPAARPARPATARR